MWDWQAFQGEGRAERPQGRVGAGGGGGGGGDLADSEAAQASMGDTVRVWSLLQTILVPQLRSGGLTNVPLQAECTCDAVGVNCSHDSIAQVIDRVCDCQAYMV